MKRFLPALWLLWLAVLSGCLVSGEINAAGAGKMTIRLRLNAPAQLDSTGRKLQSDYVRLVSAAADDEKWATYEIAFDDITQLSTTEVFASATFTLGDEGENVKKLSVRYENKKPARMSEDLLEYYGGEATFRVALPGPVVDSNGTVESQTVEWKYPMKALTDGAPFELHATFRTDSQAATPQPTGE